MKLRHLKKTVFVLCMLAFSGGSQASPALGIDFLGEMAKPLIGDAKDKVQGVLKYIWAQPYGGYAFGGGSFRALDGGAALKDSGSISLEGLIYGGRGGIELFNTFRVGVDYTRQFSHVVQGTSKYTLTSSMLGVGVGFDVPHTPVQAFLARYSKVDMQGDGMGNGWGGGISFNVVNPFIVLLEYRTVTCQGTTAWNSTTTDRRQSQYYMGLSFLLL